MFDYLLFATAGSVFPTAVAALFGLLIGSFLNVLIHRIPRMMQRESDDYIAAESADRQESLSLGSAITSISYKSTIPLPYEEPYNLTLPRSACPHCQHQITALENIPVVSYLFLRGKCSQCSAPISIRYPIVEALTSVLSAFLIWHFGSGLVGLSSLLFTYLLITMSFIDADTQYLPDNLTYPLLWTGLLINTVNLYVPLREAVFGALFGYLVLWSVNWLYMLIRRSPGMGNGDFKLLAALGAWLGWKMLFLIVLLSSLVGSVVGLTLIAMKKHDIKNAMPYGPYLAGAGMIAFLYGNDLLQLYLSPMVR